jgi:ubiquinone/menaquinone biosynthesis C-methylase UbiE
MSVPAPVSVDQVNRSEMSKPSAVAHYSRREDLSAAEAAALSGVASAAHGKKILDIGVGGGRTVAALKKISLHYLGIDNSAAMVSACQRRFADTSFEVMDARAMSSVSDASVHLAMFSCNGIGMVSHADRLLILQEVFRVLEPGGVFLFSTHNQNSADCEAGFQWPEFEVSGNPARFLVRLARFCKQVPVRWTRRRKLRSLEIRTPQYSIVNDVCHDYGVMLYYISLTEQRRQLEALGYARNAVAYDLAGALVTADSKDGSLMLVARKPLD